MNVFCMLCLILCSGCYTRGQIKDRIRASQQGMREYVLVQDQVRDAQIRRLVESKMLDVHPAPSWQMELLNNKDFWASMGAAAMAGVTALGWKVQHRKARRA